MGISADDHVEYNGSKVTGNSDNLQTRLGLRATIAGKDRHNLTTNIASMVIVIRC